MRQLLRSILKNHFLILFLVLEMLAFFLLIQNNRFHGTKYLNFMQRTNARLHFFTFRTNQYFDLKEENERLVKENLMLRDQLSNLNYKIIENINVSIDTSAMSNFKLTGAKVVNNSTNKQYNFIVVNKGFSDGIEPEMAVISPDGVVGKVKNVSEHYANVISLLNRDFMISAKLKNSEYYGPVSWEGNGYKTAYLKEIPFHVELSRGDTVVTSGFSMNFPEKIEIGRIKDFEIEGGNYYKIELELLADFKSLSNVYIISNQHKEEILSVEEGEAP